MAFRKQFLAAAVAAAVALVLLIQMTAASVDSQSYEKDKLAASQLYERLGSSVWTKLVACVGGGGGEHLCNKLESERDKLASVGDTQELAQLLEWVRKSLYEEKDCQDREWVHELHELLALFSFDRTSKLFHDLHDRTLTLLAGCRPQWDQQMGHLIQTQFDDRTRDLAVNLFENLISFSPDIKMGQLEDGRAADERVTFLTLQALDKFVGAHSAVPSSTAILLFLARFHERQLGLNENMQNPALQRRVYEESVNGLIVPLCKQVCGPLKSWAQFYLNELYFNEQLDKMRSYTELFVPFDNNKVNTWLIINTTCCRLIEPKVADQVYKRVYREITGKATVELMSQAEEDKLEAALEESDEFARKRREHFMKENGFGRMLKS